MFKGHRGRNPTQRAFLYGVLVSCFIEFLIQQEYSKAAIQHLQPKVVQFILPLGIHKPSLRAKLDKISPAGAQFWLGLRVHSERGF